MIKHQVRESLSPTIACFQELQKPRCRPLGVCFPGLWAERKAREREKHDLAGIFMLLKMTSRLLKTPGRDPPSVPASERRSEKLSLGGEAAWLVPPAWNQGYKGALFPYLPSRPSVLPFFPPAFLLAEALTLKILFCVWFQENRAESAASHPHVLCTFTRYKTVQAKSPEL